MGDSNTNFLIVGLGNPGKKYEGTRHNIGFAVVDEFLSKLKLTSELEKFESRIYEWQSEGRKVFFQKPMTFMNLSGQAVGPLANFYKIPLDNCLVIYDELDLPSGQLRIRKFGGPGGHNGMKSIIECLGSEQFPRIRLGIGRHPQIPADRYVLGKFTSEEKAIERSLVTTAVEATLRILKVGIDKAMNEFNVKKPEETK